MPIFQSNATPQGKTNELAEGEQTPPRGLAIALTHNALSLSFCLASGGE